MCVNYRKQVPTSVPTQSMHLVHPITKCWACGCAIALATRSRLHVVEALESPLTDEAGHQGCVWTKAWSLLLHCLLIFTGAWERNLMNTTELHFVWMDLELVWPSSKWFTSIFIRLISMSWMRMSLCFRSHIHPHVLYFCVTTTLNLV